MFDFFIREFGRDFVICCSLDNFVWEIYIYFFGLLYWDKFLD